MKFRKKKKNQDYLSENPSEDKQMGIKPDSQNKSKQEEIQTMRKDADNAFQPNSDFRLATDPLGQLPKADNGTWLSYEEIVKGQTTQLSTNFHPINSKTTVLSTPIDSKGPQVPRNHSSGSSSDSSPMVEEDLMDKFKEGEIGPEPSLLGEGLLGSLTSLFNTDRETLAGAGRTILTILNLLGTGMETAVNKPEQINVPEPPPAVIPKLMKTGMLACPACGVHFRPGFSHCPNCEIPLDLPQTRITGPIL